MDNEKLAYNILNYLGIAVLQRLGPSQYSILGEPPPFYQALFPPIDGKPCAEPWQHSPMLELFIGDAEQFFEQDGYGTLSSGMWQEDGKTDGNSAMLATATVLDNQQLLIIKMLQEDFFNHASILRKAREELLEKRMLTHNLEIFKKKSMVDGLTKIFNKATFWELLQDEIKRSQILNYPLSMLFIDIDNFKKINDTYGHLSGDTILQSLGEQFTKTLRRSDIVARYGGDEFVVLIPHETQEWAAEVAEKLRQNVESMHFPTISSITVSIGCATHALGEGADNFIIRNDKALYEAKKQGRNKVCNG